MARHRLFAALVVILPLAWVGACGWLWPLEGQYDPHRCDPPCKGGQVCSAGECVTDGGSSRDHGPRADQARPPDRGAPPEQGAQPDGPLPAPDKGLSYTPPGTWVIIPKGQFAMGRASTKPCSGYKEVFKETPHPVKLNQAFLMMTTEVTQAQFQAIRGYNPSAHGPNGAKAACGTNCPVERVTWHEAAAYCNLLSVKAKLPECYSCTGFNEQVNCNGVLSYSGALIYSCPGYRLPTEAEWEYAYRAGTKTHLYNGKLDSAACEDCKFGHVVLNEIAWYCANSGKRTRPVGQKLANAWNLRDMSGNVYEWCHDWLQIDLGHLPVTNPVASKGAAGGNMKVLRGGGWTSSGHNLRGGYRHAGSSTTRASSWGLRCVRTK